MADQQLESTVGAIAAKTNNRLVYKYAKNPELVPSQPKSIA